MENPFIILGETISSIVAIESFRIFGYIMAIKKLSTLLGFATPKRSSLVAVPSNCSSKRRLEFARVIYWGLNSGVPADSFFCFGLGLSRNLAFEGDFSRISLTASFSTSIPNAREMLDKSFISWLRSCEIQALEYPPNSSGLGGPFSSSSS